MSLRNLRKDESGATAVIVGILLAVLLGLLGLVVDMGRSYSLKADMQSACDLAAMSGAQVLAKNTANTSGAKSAAENCAELNGFNPGEYKVEIIDGTKVRVTIQRQQTNLFAGAVGVSKMNVKRTGTAAIMNESSDADFDYSIFSGSEKEQLKMGSQTIVEGKVHTNQNLYIDAGHMEAKAYSYSGSSAYLNNAYYYGTDKVATSGDALNCGVIPMPYYLGDAIEEMIVEPSSPFSLTWADKITTNELSPWSEPGTRFLSDIKKGTSVHVEFSGSQPWMDKGLNGSGRIFFDCSRDVTFQLAKPWNESTQIFNGDIYVYNPGHTTNLQAHSEITINGNIYCLGGDLIIEAQGGSDKFTINGNIYCKENLKTCGGKGLKVRGDFIYAKSMDCQNDYDITSVVVVENNFHAKGGLHNSDGNGKPASMSIYSKSGNIDFTGANTVVEGYVFAPYGDIHVDGNTTVYGKIIGNTISNLPGTFYVYPSINTPPFLNNPSKPKTTKKVVKLIE